MQSDKTQTDSGFRNSTRLIRNSFDRNLEDTVDKKLLDVVTRFKTSEDITETRNFSIDVAAKEIQRSLEEGKEKKILGERKYRVRKIVDKLEGKKRKLCRNRKKIGRKRRNEKIKDRG